MRLDNVCGYFDCREFDARKAYQDRQMKADSQQVGFNMTFAPDALPECVAEFAKEFERKDGSKAFAVKVKVGAKCKFFRKENGVVKQVVRPTNEELDGERWEVCLDFAALHGDATKKEACGYWANGILLVGTQSDMFADLSDEGAAQNGNLPDEVAQETAENLPF